MYNKNEWETEIAGLDKKQAERLQVFKPVRLIAKLEEKGIEDEKLKQDFSELLGLFKDVLAGDKKQKKYYLKKHRNIIDYTHKTYSLVPKGYYPEVYLAIGMAIGSGFGAILSTTIQTSFLAVGIGFGMAIGVAIGSGMDKKAEKEGRIY